MGKEGQGRGTGDRDRTVAGRGWQWRVCSEIAACPACGKLKSGGCWRVGLRRWLFTIFSRMCLVRLSLAAVAWR